MAFKHRSSWRSNATSFYQMVCNHPRASSTHVVESVSLQFITGIISSYLRERLGACVVDRTMRIIKQSQ